MGVAQCNKVRHSVSFDPMFYQELKKQTSLSFRGNFSALIEDALEKCYPDLAKKVKKQKSALY